MQTNPHDARAYALVVHGDQRYGSHPYVIHLDAVADIVKPFGREAQVVAYLHDTVEDTTVTLDEVRKHFGDSVAMQVALLTDEPGGTRQERKAKTNAKLAQAAEAQSIGLIVKAADRLANLRMSDQDADGKQLAKYHAEHPEFEKAAYRPGLCDTLWSEMASILSNTAPASNGQAAITRDTNEPPRCHLLTAPELSDEMLHDALQTMAVYVEESHLFRRLLKCKECGQLYFFEFYEEIMWSHGGKDVQYITWLPVSNADEARRISKLSEMAVCGLPGLQISDDLTLKADQHTGPRRIGAWITPETRAAALAHEEELQIQRDRIEATSWTKVADLIDDDEGW